MRRQQKIFFLVTTFFFWSAMYTYPVLLSNHVTESLGGTSAMAGLVVGSYGFTQMLLRIPVGFLSDKWRRRKPFLLAGMGCALLAALGLYAARHAAVALVARGVAGMAAATWVCFTVLYGSGQPEGARVRAMGTLSSTMYAAQLTATLVGSAVAQAVGVRSSFMLAVAIAVFGVVFAMRIEDIPPKSVPITPTAVAKVIRDPLLLFSSFLTILIQMIMWATLYGFSPGWAREVLGADSGQLGLLSTVHLIPSVLLSRLATSVIVPRIGERGTSAIGFVSLTIGCVFMPLTTSFGQMLCLQALCGIGVGCVAPLMLALCGRRIDASLQGVAMGAYQSLYGIGMFMGPILAGWLMEVAARGMGGVDALIPGYRAVFLCAAGIGALGAVLSAFLPQKRRDLA